MTDSRSDSEERGISFRCYYDSDDGIRYTSHYRTMPPTDIPRWIEAYRFTHPDCLSITCKVWFTKPPDYYTESGDEES